jgi:hypothetical protein
MAALAAVVALLGPRADDGRLTIGIEGNTIGIGAPAVHRRDHPAAGRAHRPVRRAPGAGRQRRIGRVVSRGRRVPRPASELRGRARGDRVIWLARAPRKTLPVLLVVVAGAALLPFVSLPERVGSAD